MKASLNGWVLRLHNPFVSKGWSKFEVMDYEWEYVGDLLRVYSVSPSVAIKRSMRYRKFGLKVYLYHLQVWSKTECVCHFVEGIEKRGALYHIDHIVPVSYGFSNDIFLI